MYFVVFHIFGFGKKLDLNVEDDLSELCISLINKQSLKGFSGSVISARVRERRIPTCVAVYRLEAF